MKEGYDLELFNQLYNKTKKLRRKLAFGIDSRRFGVDDSIVLSWFDDKFIFAFNKYCDIKEPELLKGYIINALTTFRYRIMREAYANKNLYHRDKISISDEHILENLISEKEEYLHPPTDPLIDKIFEYMKTKLSDDAFMVFEAQYKTPVWIMGRLDPGDKKARTNIPNKLIAEYYGLPLCEYTYEYIGELKKEIKEAISCAREYFLDSTNTETVS